MTITIGIIGTGSIAETHAQAIESSKEVTLVAVLSRSEEAAKAFASQRDSSGIAEYTTLESFTADETIDLVVIASPDKLHASQAKHCLEAGKHVLCEKPLTTDSKQGEQLLTLATSKNLLLATGFHLRSHTGHIELHKKIVEENCLGILRHIRAFWTFKGSPDNWRAHSKVGKWWSLAAVGSHCIDQARWFADDQEEWQQFRTVISNNKWNSPHDETATLAAQFSTGPTVEITSSAQFASPSRLEIYGEYGYAICEDTFGRHGGGTIMLNGKPLAFTPQNPFLNQIEHIADCIHSGEQPRNSGPIGLRSVRDLLLANNV